ncbi:MAG: inositol monophosphatase family protein [Myxococcota bacterium]|nr:inositol monophosphatase family protein [Myxococcota bacterium]
MLELAEEAARAAGEIIRAGSARDVRRKGVVDLVTEVDFASEARIREILTAGAPGIPVLGEEEGGAEAASTRWIVDPLDGTVNFVHGLPAYCVCIALQDGGDLELGVVYDPNGDRCFRAVRGGGAELDGRSLRVSATTDLGEALLASGFPYDRRDNADYYLRFLKAFLERAQGFRRPGSAGLDLVTLASGALDGFWEFGLKPWDVAAGTLIIREAGGVVTDLDGSPLNLDRPRVLATNGHIHDAMLAVVADLL